MICKVINIDIRNSNKYVILWLIMMKKALLFPAGEPSKKKNKIKRSRNCLQLYPKVLLVEIITASSYNKWDELKFGADFKQFWPTIKRPKLPLKATGVFLCFSSTSAALQRLFTLCFFVTCFPGWAATKSGLMAAGGGLSRRPTCAPTSAFGIWDGIFFFFFIEINKKRGVR